MVEEQTSTDQKAKEVPKEREQHVERHDMADCV